MAQVYWAVAALCFFVFFRLGELLSSDASSPPSLKLGRHDLHQHLRAIYDEGTPAYVKMQSVWKGADVFVGKTGNALCPVVACLAYLTLRGMMDPGTFFLKLDC